MNESAGGASGAAAAGPDTPGGMLRAQRERRGLSVQHAAEEMHLDVRVIEAIEQNRFLTLGPPVYAKGHLRKYAALVGLSPATVLERYEALSGTPTVPPPIPAAIATPVRAERRRIPRLPLLIVVAIAVAAGLAWLVLELLRSRISDNTATSALPAATAPQPAVSEPIEQATAPVEQTAAPAPDAPTPTLPRSAGEGREGAKAVTATAGEVRVRLQFSESSWAEIYDATGKRLMFDMGAAGRSRTIAGVPPLRVNLGLASAVSMQVDEQPIVVPRRAGQDRTKFLIEADGSVKPDTSLKTAERLE
jgi:cytoskeleton protein RodZ